MSGHLLRGGIKPLTELDLVAAGLLHPPAVLLEASDARAHRYLEVAALAWSLDQPHRLALLRDAAMAVRAQLGTGADALWSLGRLGDDDRWAVAPAVWGITHIMDALSPALSTARAGHVWDPINHLARLADAVRAEGHLVPGLARAVAATLADVPTCLCITIVGLNGPPPPPHGARHLRLAAP